MQNDIHGFTNPILAVEYFRNNAANYNIVITDIRTQQMNGFEVERAVKEIRPDINYYYMQSCNLGNRLL
jgi:DNA-binding NtrC family response regulator